MSLPTSVTWDGRVWTLSRAGYLVRKSEYLHRAKWERYRGPIPAGHHIHHKNHDKSDNRLVNLECLSAREHRREHDNSAALQTAKARAASLASRLTPECRARIRASFVASQERYRASAKSVRCETCGKTMLKDHWKRKFCSDKCSHRTPSQLAGRRARAASNRYDEQRTCRMCAATFTVNKHKKTQCCSRSCGNAYGHQIRKEK